MKSLNYIAGKQKSNVNWIENENRCIVGGCAWVGVSARGKDKPRRNPK